MNEWRCRWRAVPAPPCTNLQLPPFTVLALAMNEWILLTSHNLVGMLAGTGLPLALMIGSARLLSLLTVYVHGTATSYMLSNYTVTRYVLYYYYTVLGHTLPFQHTMVVSSD